MKRPSFQFYPADWRANAKLRRCSPAARGAWMDVLCLLHDADDYGIQRWPLADIAQAAGVPLKLLRELADKGVLKGSDKNCEAFTFTPTHAGKKGETVTLIEAAAGPCWYCSRFVEDEYIRQRRGTATRFDSENQPPKPEPKASPKPPIGGRQGDGPTSTSTSTSVTTTSASSQTLEGATAAGLACRLMREAGCARTNPSHPDLLAALAEGITAQVLADTVREAIDGGKTNPFTYAITTARSRRAEGARPVITGPPRIVHDSRTHTGLTQILGDTRHDQRSRTDLVLDADPRGAGDALHPEPRRIPRG